MRPASGKGDWQWGLGSWFHWIGVAWPNPARPNGITPTPDFAIAGWWPVMLFGVPTFLLFRAERRAKRLANTNACPSCGYSLAGLPPGAEGKCPECGGARGKA